MIIEIHAKKQYKMNQKKEVPKEIQHAGVEVVNKASEELLSEWKPKTVAGKILKWFSKVAISIGVSTATKNINKQ